ncbi:MAG: 16S rRNA (cytidine(1402)-2'-O)-methyltransferase [Pseudomonadota bacterium]
MNDNKSHTTQKAQVTLDNNSKDHSPKNDHRKDLKSSQTEQGAIPLKAGLYLVSTPIGNLRDITFRALDILSSVDLVVCEDTRVTGKLLKAYGFKKKMQVYNDHSSESTRENILKLIDEGQSVAILSDAGMPLISDPGYKLVKEATNRDLFITSLPGPNAALTALQLSALPTDQFSFLGFLPNKSSARQSLLLKYETTPGSLIAYETGPRLLDSLADIKETLGNRSVSVLRELTKIYEERKNDQLSDLIQYYKKESPPKGEIVIVIGAAIDEPQSKESIEEQLKKALQTMSVRDAAEMVSKAIGKPKKTIYTLALKLASNQKSDKK